MLVLLTNIPFHSRLLFHMCNVCSFLAEINYRSFLQFYSFLIVSIIQSHFGNLFFLYVLEDGPQIASDVWLLHKTKKGISPKLIGNSMSQWGHFHGDLPGVFHLGILCVCLWICMFIYIYVYVYIYILYSHICVFHTIIFHFWL